MYKVKKLICTLLAVCIISTTLAQPVQAFTGAEGAILGGGAGLASISLTAPQVALLVAAGFGIVVAVENADMLSEGMTAALNTAAAGVDAGAEVLEQWLDAAKKGSIAIASAPAWIAGAIKGWISGLYDSANNTPLSYVQNVTKGSVVPAVDFWGTSTFTVPFDGTMVRVGDCKSVITSSGPSYQCVSMIYIFRPFSLGKPNNYTDVVYGDPSYYYKLVTWGSTISANTTFDYDVKAIESCKALPSVSKIKDTYLNTVNPGSGWSEAKAVLWAYSQGLIENPSGSICPDKTVGGIGAALEDGKSIDAVNMPDLDVAGSKSICPDGVLDGSIPIADTVADVIVGLTDGTMTWTDYVSDVAVGTPTISVPVEGTESGVVDYPITDTGVSDTPIESNPDTPGEGTQVPEGLAPYTVQLKDFFPFCIPFDIVDFVGVLCADPVAPSFEWTFTQYTGQKDTLEIDLAPFDEVAQLLRNMELLLFIIGLAFLTRNLIRG